MDQINTIRHRGVKCCKLDVEGRALVVDNGALIRENKFKMFLMTAMKLTIRYSRNIIEVANRIRAEKQAMVRRIVGSYRRWQHDLIVLLRTRQPRRIYWVYDPIGNSGKSLLSSDLVATHSALRLENCKTADAAYAYNGQKLVLFDFARTSIDVINYGLIESLKNGCIFSSKYESCMKLFDYPEVVVFANFDCPPGKFSNDRIYTIYIHESGPDRERQMELVNEEVTIHQHADVIDITDDDFECIENVINKFKE